MFKNILLALVASTAQAHASFEDDPDAQLLTNREGSAQMDTGNKASNFKTESQKFSLMYKFSDETEQKQRGDFEITRNAKTNEIVKVNLNNDQGYTTADNFEQLLTKKCDQGKLLQFEVNELNLFTSMSACYYLNSSGLNDTISFQTDSGSKNIVGMQVETKDVKHLLSVEKNRKKIRLLKEKQYKLWTPKGVLSKMIEGSHPEYLLEYDVYDSQGGINQKKAQKKINKAKNAGATKSAGGQQSEEDLSKDDEEPEEEKSFFSKYWWHLLIGFMLIQTLVGGDDPKAAAPAAGGRPSRQQ